MNIPFEDLQKIAIYPKMKGLGGPASFYRLFRRSLDARSIQVAEAKNDLDVDAALIIGGTRQLDRVFQFKRKGIPIIQRLNGMNWLHRKRWQGLRYYLKAELNNQLLAFIRRFVADGIVYQSRFARDWWQTVFRTVHKPGEIIHNGTDLSVFTPEGDSDKPSDRFRMILVEGNIRRGYELGLFTAYSFIKQISESHDKLFELQVVGHVPDEIKQMVQPTKNLALDWTGVVPHEKVPYLNRSAHLFFSSDLNAACPNSVIEASACGLPVLGYATGAIPELVTNETGAVVPYGSNFWDLEPPEIENLVSAVDTMLPQIDTFGKKARERAEQYFDYKMMVDSYLEFINRLRN